MLLCYIMFFLLQKGEKLDLGICLLTLYLEGGGGGYPPQEEKIMALKCMHILI